MLNALKYPIDVSVSTSHEQRQSRYPLFACYQLSIVVAFYQLVSHLLTMLELLTLTSSTVEE
jgi:hypothetical protein